MCCSNEKKQKCQKPENLTGSPKDCAPEQVKDCHGDVNAHSCVETTGCEHTERLQGKPGE